MRYFVALRRGVSLGLVIVCALSAAGFGAAAAREPSLAITDPEPLTIRGVQFAPGERVIVTATIRVRRTRTVSADARGRFVVRFAGLSVLDTCDDYVIKAVGSRGTRAAIRVKTVCPVEFAKAR